MTPFKKSGLLISAILLAAFSFAQTDENILPKTSLLSAKLFGPIEEHVLHFDKALASAMDSRDDKLGHTPKFALTLPADINLLNSGTWTPLPNGDRVWRVRISSPGALALIPCYDSFYLPKGTTLHVYNSTKDELIGAFTYANNPASGWYNTGLIHGDACIIEYYEPAVAIGRGRLHIHEVGHAYRMVPHRSVADFGEAGSCEVNVNCSEGANWQDQKNAVVRILIKTAGQFGWCSGALVNNTNHDCTPYILSADHCYQDDLSGQVANTNELGQWLFYFNYESPNCNNPASEGTLGNHFITGCSFKAASLDTGGNSGSDFVLIQLSASPPLSYRPYFSGWSAINTAPHHGVGIHHPNADIKKISAFDTTATNTSYGSVPNTHWDMNWIATAHGHGVTEPGSSGSPLFDVNKRIVGTLTGGDSYCQGLTLHDQYGKMAFHWVSNGTGSNKRLKNWLDPNNSGMLTLDGLYSPCTASTALDAAITSISQQGNICDSMITLSATLMNYGNSTLSSAQITFVIDGGSPQQLAWSGSLGSFQAAIVSLPAQTFAPGMHTVTISSSSPNGGTDGNGLNDSYTKNFNITSTTNTYAFTLQTGDLGDQITWELVDVNQNVVYSGGPYMDNLSGVQINQNWCLPHGCYTFNIFSSGNGLRGSSMSGTYAITDINGTAVARLQHVNFGMEESNTICNHWSLGIADDLSSNEISIYPNPSTGIFTLDNVSQVHTILVTDVLGRIVATKTTRDQYTIQIDLSQETNGIYFFRLQSDSGSVTKKVMLARR